MIKKKYMRLHIHLQFGGIYVIVYMHMLCARWQKKHKSKNKKYITEN